MAGHQDLWPLPELEFLFTMIKFSHILVLPLLATTLIIMSACQLVERHPHFKPGPPMNIKRVQHTASLLKDGRVLIAGGRTSCKGEPSFCDDYQTEIYDPHQNKFILADKLKAPLYQAFSLPSGKVVFIGSQAQIYDPKTENICLSGKMLLPRTDSYSATLMKNGKILIAGGLYEKENMENVALVTEEAEIFDPVTETFSKTGPLSRKRFSHTAALLPNGNVLILEGTSEKMDGTCIETPEIYDPNTGKFTLSKATMLCRTSYEPVLLPDGNVLLHGGSGAKGHYFETPPDQIYLTKEDKFITLPGIISYRHHQKAILLPSGNVLFIGGTNGGFGAAGVLKTTELYDYRTQTFKPGPSMNKGRFLMSQTVLKDGRVLITGGKSGGKFIKDTEIYEEGK